MRVVSISGSLRAGSTTEQALQVALQGAAAAGAEVEMVDLAHFDLPWCDGRADEASYGGDTARLRAVIAGADAIIMGSPEYHGSLSGSLKNAIDLLGPDHLQGKLIGLIATARGPAGAMNTLNHLRHIARWVGAWVLPHQVSIPEAAAAFSGGEVVRAGLEDDLTEMGRELVRYGGLLTT